MCKRGDNKLWELSYIIYVEKVYFQLEDKRMKIIRSFSLLNSKSGKFDYLILLQVSDIYHILERHKSDLPHVIIIV